MPEALSSESRANYFINAAQNNSQNKASEFDTSGLVKATPLTSDTAAPHALQMLFLNKGVSNNGASNFFVIKPENVVKLGEESSNISNSKNVISSININDLAGSNAAGPNVGFSIGPDARANVAAGSNSSAVTDSHNANYTSLSVNSLANLKHASPELYNGLVAFTTKSVYNSARSKDDSVAYSINDLLGNKSGLETSDAPDAKKHAKDDSALTPRTAWDVTKDVAIDVGKSAWLVFMVSKIDKMPIFAPLNIFLFANDVYNAIRSSINKESINDEIKKDPETGLPICSIDWAGALRDAQVDFLSSLGFSAAYEVAGVWHSSNNKFELVSNSLMKNVTKGGIHGAMCSFTLGIASDRCLNAKIGASIDKSQKLLKSLLYEEDEKSEEMSVHQFKDNVNHTTEEHNLVQDNLIEDQHYLPQLQGDVHDNFNELQ